MSNHQIKVGDIVRLKSGGPNVSSAEGSDCITAIWFNFNSDRGDSYAAQTITLSPETVNEAVNHE